MLLVGWLIGIILPGLMIKQKVNVLMAASEMVFRFIELRYVD